MLLNRPIFSKFSGWSIERIVSKLTWTRIICNIFKLPLITLQSNYKNLSERVCSSATLKAVNWVLYQRHIKEHCGMWHEALCNNSSQLWNMNFNVRCDKLCKPSLLIAFQWFVVIQLLTMLAKKTNFGKKSLIPSSKFIDGFY